MLREVVSAVETAGGPEEIKLSLSNSIFDPVVAHVEGFGALHANLRREDVMCCGIVGFDGCARDGLWVSELDKSLDDRNSFLRPHEDTSSFGFGCRCWDTAESFNHDVKRAIGLMLGRGDGGAIG